jgi:hypothetical protein
MLLSSLLAILEADDFNLSNEDLIFNFDGGSFGTTDSTAFVRFRFEPGYDTAKFKLFFTFAFFLSQKGYNDDQFNINFSVTEEQFGGTFFRWRFN